MITCRWQKSWIQLLGIAALIGWGILGSASAEPTVAQMLSFKPKQTGVDCDVPNFEEQKTCTVRLVREGKGSGWLMSNAAGPIRRFFDGDGDKKIDEWSYFKNGLEVYREIDSTHSGRADQYRWLNSAGQKWGVDRNEDGHVDHWKAISPEEVSHEIVLAIQQGSFQRLSALMLTDGEMSSLHLLPAERQRFETLIGEAPNQFRDLGAKIKDASKMKWVHLETSAPHCRPASAEGSRVDLVYHPRGTILYDVAGKNDWLQTGVMIQVGAAWRIVAAPKLGHASEDVTVASRAGGPRNEKLEKLIGDLSKHDRNAPQIDAAPGANATVVQHNLKRADLLESIIAEVKPQERETWIRQVADTLSTAAQSSPIDDKTALKRLQSLEQQIVTAMKGSDLAAYVSFRQLQADYASKLINPKADFTKVQEEWIEHLTQFVSTHQKSRDAADALLQMGMVSEFLAKETEAKKWYQQLARDHGSHPLALKANGALKRLSLKGNALELSGAKIAGGTYDVRAARGKVAAIYYWASWNHQTAEDFAKLSSLSKSLQSKGLEIVTVNLDEDAAAAKALLQKHAVPGNHLREDGGLESKLATDYGIMVLPHVIVVDRQGKVVNANVQTSMLEDELKKILK